MSSIKYELKEGFYLDTKSKRTFYLKIVNNKPLIPVFVKSDLKDWKKLSHGNKT